MSSQTTHGYVTYAPADTDATFLEFRTNIAGTSNSNFTKIDEDITSLEDRATALEGGKSPIGHTHTTSDITDFPTNVSAFNNDGDGNSPYATEDYVDVNGGKIDIIKFNGTAQTITNKTVSMNESDPVFNASPAAGITANNITTWDAAVQPQALADAVGAEAEERENADTDLQGQINDIDEVISLQATSTNKLVSASEMGDAISSVEAKQLYATNTQGSFATKAALNSATTFYNADGTVATPTKNDVAYVLADESHDGKSAKYVIASTGPIVWGFVITFSDNTFTQAQMNAINSNITDTKRQSYDTHIADTTIHVTSSDKTNWNSKENTSNKKSSWSATPNNTNYPSEKLVKDSLDLKFNTSKIHFVTTPPTSGGSDGDIWFVYET